MASRYMAGVDKAVENTPAERKRVVDTWRVIALAIVVLGHWLSASVWIQTDGAVTVMNTLEWIPYAGWFSHRCDRRLLVLKPGNALEVLLSAYVERVDRLRPSALSHPPCSLL